MINPSSSAIPGKEHYSKETRYLHGGRLHSYAHQIEAVIEQSPLSVLEVGSGPGMVTAALRAIGIEVSTLDKQPALGPDLVGSVTAIPAPDKCFDVSLCCQVLEHLTFAEFEPALRELRRVTQRTLIISLPDVTPHYHVDVCLPKIGRQRWQFSRPVMHSYPLPVRRLKKAGTYGKSATPAALCRMLSDRSKRVDGVWFVAGEFRKLPGIIFSLLGSGT